MCIFLIKFIMKSNFRTKLINILAFLLLPLTTPLQFSCYLQSSNFQLLPNLYECEVSTPLTILTKSTKLTTSPQPHSSDLSNNDVTAFTAKLKTIFYFPLALDEIFPNLLAIKITQCQLKEIQRENLEKFPQLRWLSLSNNQLEVIEAGLFDGNSNLIFISLRFNRIKHIEASGFDGCGKSLIKLWLDDNFCVSKNAQNRFEVTALVEEVKENCQSIEWLKNELKMCKMRNLNLTEEIEGRELRILELEGEVEKLKRVAAA